MRVLALEDNLAVCRALHAALDGHEVDVALDPIGARMALREAIPDVLILDLRVGPEALELIRHVRHGLGLPAPILLLSAPIQDEAVGEALAAGATAHLLTPFTPDGLRAAIAGITSVPAGIPAA